MLTIDHIAICCETLAEGRDWVEQRLGVPLQMGGEHAHFGTHNLLLGLAEDLYLEVIAINPNAPRPDYPRWFDLDGFQGAPRPTTWIARTDDLSKTLTHAPQGAGVPVALSRADLRWHMAVPTTGISPFDGLFPAMIEWQGDAHPASRLTQQGVCFVGMTLNHPDAAGLSDALSPLINDPRIQICKGASQMRLTFGTPNGTVTL